MSTDDILWQKVDTLISQEAEKAQAFSLGADRTPLKTPPLLPRRAASLHAIALASKLATIQHRCCLACGRRC